MYVLCGNVINFITQISGGNTGNDTDDVTISVTDYPPRNYNITFNFTDIYGQTTHEVTLVPLAGTVILTI